MTSIYRQLGTGTQSLFRRLLMDGLSLNDEQSIWKYELPQLGGKRRFLTMDGRIDLHDLSDEPARHRVRDWVLRVCEAALVPPDEARRLRGCVFEVRQGYKSKDSKRQNADIGSAASAYIGGYLPVLFLASNQIDDDVANRYIEARWVLLRGTVGDNDRTSTFAFMKATVGFDFLAFLERNADRVRSEVEAIVQSLLRPEP